MTYHGTVKNGVVVPDASAQLREGERVRIEPIEDPVAQPGTASAVLAAAAAGTWAGPPGELERLLSEVEALRDQDLDSDAGDRLEPLP